ncbi:transcription factor IIIC subunit delta N-term-domain-containing protein [Apiospora kogelbergensis]|uniref:transcription factor IIIC subunit delta N-term-domain-containing protein n=1 Tax=Apiospora kogelbergensis TaxID=1337665 RepID=UPI003131B22F
MSAQDRSHILPLESFSLNAVPLTTHNIAWSPDAELAITSDDCVYLYFPEFPSTGTTAAAAFGSDFESQRQYHEVTFRFPVVEIRRPELNRHLFTAAEQEFPDFPATFGAGISLVANNGTSLNHAVAVAWSPSGLGLMRRSVLAVLTGTGALTIFCEGVSDGLGTIKMKGRNVRTVSSWVVPWSVGDNLLIPRAKSHESDYSKERITSFAWANETKDPGSLLAYVNDEDEVVVLTVQSKHDPAAPSGSAGEWRVEEVARFMANGPHPKGDPTHPDYSPQGSSFALRWSPWLRKGPHKTCFLSYITAHYVGFREVTIRAWKHMETPKINVQSFDTNGICIHLAPDAFLQWEDMVWTVEGGRVCRGIIATPARVQPFQVTFDDAAPPEVTTPHSAEVCGTNYASNEEAEQASNPITGMVIHPPNLSESTPTPHFSLVRLSATVLNHDWYQTNLPIASDSNDPSSKPKWVTEMTQFMEEKQPIALAYRPVNPDGKLPKGDNDEDAAGDEEEYDDDSDDEDEDEDEDGSDWGSVEDFSKTEYLGELDRLAEMEKVSMTRLRTWGMTSSPGGGTHAVFVTLNSTIKPERHTFGGMRCRVLFGPNIAPRDDNILAMKSDLSTEGRMWEWMYGGGPPVPGASDLLSVNHTARTSAREKFKEFAAAQTCNCASTGIPITTPGSTHTCSVCGLKCLKPQQVKALAQDSDLHDHIEKEVSGELCGGCSGKFMN